MFKYRKLFVKQDKSPENEIRVNNRTLNRNYLRYAYGLLEEKKAEKIIVRSIGTAIPKCLALVDLIRRRVAGLHMNVDFGVQEMVDKYEPIEEGLDPVTVTRKIPNIIVTLSKKPLDVSSPGYHAPLPEKEVVPYVVRGPGERPEGRTAEGEEGRPYRPRGRGRGRGRGRRPRYDEGEYQGEREDREEGEYYPRRSRGRGRGPRRSRYQQEGARDREYDEGEYQPRPRRFRPRGEGGVGRPRGEAGAGRPRGRGYIGRYRPRAGAQVA